MEFIKYQGREIAKGSFGGAGRIWKQRDHVFLLQVL
jgi:hypothetical protein